MKEGSQETWKTAYLLLIGLSLIPFGFHLLFRKKSIHYERKKLTINAARFEAQNLRLPSFCVFFSKGSLLKLHPIEVIFLCAFSYHSRVISLQYILFYFSITCSTRKINQENSSTYAWFPKSTMHICSCALPKIRFINDTHDLNIKVFSFSATPKMLQL